MAILLLNNYDTEKSMVILINYKENYDTTTTTIQWVLTSVQFNLVCFLSQSGSWEILVRVAIPTRTVCARGLATRTEHWFWFIFLCAWLSHAHVRVAKSRARILYTKSRPVMPGLCGRRAIQSPSTDYQENATKWTMEGLLCRLQGPYRRTQGILLSCPHRHILQVAGGVRDKEHRI